MQSWSVGYFVLPGKTSDNEDKCWSDLRNIIGSDFYGLRWLGVLIDAGFNTPVVYDFCASFDGGVLPCMGDVRVGKSKELFLRRDVMTHDTERIDVYIDQLKQQIYSWLPRQKKSDKTRPVGYCAFPDDYPDKFFKGITAEARVTERTKTGIKRYWKKLRERNEQLDCRVYALAALHVSAKEICEHELKIDGIDWDEFWDYIKDNIEQY